MPKYRALAPLYVRKLLKAGEEFESDLPPGRNWEPMDDEARAAKAKVREEKGAVIDLASRLDPKVPDKAAVEIAEDWKGFSANKRRALARRLGAMSNVTADDANSFIAAELERRRGQKVA